jgi:hypothetical protein
MAIESLGRLEQVLDRLVSVPRRVAVIAAPRLTELLQSQFAEGKDPYGRPWRLLKPSTLRTGRRNPPLTGFTRKLRDGTKAATQPSNRAGIRVKVGARYGFFHQSGFQRGHTYVAPRRILPQFGLPIAWSRVLKESAKQAAREAVRA